MTKSITIIPAIDLLDGQVVRLTQGDYSHVETYTFSPADIAKQFEDAGATRIHIVDLNGAKDGKLINSDAISSIRKTTSCELELGGGIRSMASAAHLFDLGLNYLILGSLLVNDFDEAMRIISAHPKQIIAGIDAKDNYVAIEGWREGSKKHAFSFAEELSDLPLESVIYTDIATDGMMTGPNIPALKEMSQRCALPVIASGGIRNTDDIHAINTMSNGRIFGCIIGKAVLSGHMDIHTLWKP